MVFDGLAEYTCKTDDGKGDDVVKQNDRQNTLPRCEIRKGVEPQKLLDRAVDCGGEKSPAESVAIRNDGDGKHGCDRYRTAIGQVDDLDKAQYGGKCDHNSAFG